MTTSVISAASSLGAATFSIAPGRSPLYIVAVLIALTVNVYPAPVFSHDAELIRIKVRAVAAKDTPPTKSSRKADSRLDDLRPKLEVLSRKYAHYELSCSQQAEIEMNKKTDLKLSNGHTVSVRPMHHTGDHLLRVKWTSPDGMKLLDTRLRFDRSLNRPYAPVLAGAEVSESEGVILAIEVFDE